MLEADVLGRHLLPGSVQVVPAYPGGQVPHLGAVPGNLFQKHTPPGGISDHGRPHRRLFDETKHYPDGRSRIV